jgi:hypothetical protein
VLKNPGDVILSPSLVILSAVKNLGILLRVNSAKNLGIYGIKQIQISYVACGSSG